MTHRLWFTKTAGMSVDFDQHFPTFILHKSNTKSYERRGVFLFIPV